MSITGYFGFLFKNDNFEKHHPKNMTGFHRKSVCYLQNIYVAYRVHLNCASLSWFWGDLKN